MNAFLAFTFYVLGFGMSWFNNWPAATFFMVTACFWLLLSLVERKEGS
jgi:hypothetical protein